MSVSRTCDHCQQPMGSYDAGQVPVVMRVGGIELVVHVVARDGVTPNVRPDCLKTMMAEAELVYPPRRQAVKAGLVVDQGAVESEADEARTPVPLRATS